MAVYGYPYDPSTMDLWLYADEVISHSGGNTTVKTPVAWNPTSPLYPYRKSLHGLALKRRYKTTSVASLFPSLYAAYSQYNDPSNPANDWVYWNTYPMGFVAPTKRYLPTCGHCYNITVGRARNPSLFWSGGVFAANSFNDRMISFRWMDKDNVITDSFDTTEVLAPYYTNANPAFNINGTDAPFSELPSDLSFDPVKVADIRNLSPGSRFWGLDSNMIISSHEVQSSKVRLVAGPTIGSVASREDFTSLPLFPDGSKGPSTMSFYTHDSGSIAFVEISPPTSAEAGDGVVALLPRHVFSMGTAYDTTMWSERNSPGYRGSQPFVTTIRSYLESVGDPWTDAQALRQHDDLLLVNQDDRVLERVLAIQSSLASLVTP